MLAASFTLAGRTIENGGNPFLIAEAGSNFNQDFDTARRLIDVAAESGADAVKFQLFRSDILYPTDEKMRAIFRSVELNADWVPQLSEHARSRELCFLASAFDAASIDVLEAIGIAAHKVASSETVNVPLLARMARTGKPLLISTGMCDLADVRDAIEVCRESGNEKIALLKCSAAYPLEPRDANLRAIALLQSTFGCPVGFSDHTLGQAVSVAAVGLGAAVFEKHFTLDRSATGPDHFYALEPQDLKRCVADIREAFAAMGRPVLELLPVERETGRREGLYAARAIARGAQLSAADIEVKRPALGLRARFLRSATGATCARDLAKGEPITWASLTW